MQLLKPFLIILLALLGAVVCPFLHADTFTNPIIPPNSADIFIRYYEGRYYALTTHGDLQRAPEDRLRSKVVIYSSPTLAGLATAEPVLIRDEGSFIESPELWQFNHHWYLYYTVPEANVNGAIQNNCVQVLESAGRNPLGPYERKGTVETGKWDATILELKGRRYLISSPGDGIQIQEMASPWQLAKTPCSYLSKMDQSWERGGRDAHRHFMEAPEAWTHKDETFIFYTVGDYATNDYYLGALKYSGGDPLLVSSWKKMPGPLFKGNNDKSMGAGDCTPFTAADGSTWFAYGAWDKTKPSLERSCRAQKLSFDASGEPKFPGVIDPGILIIEPSSR